MKISTVEKLVEKHVQHIMKVRNSPNKVTVKLEHGGDYWLADPNNPQYVAARKATVAVHGIEPDLTREGGSIPITCKFEFCFFREKYNFVLFFLISNIPGANRQKCFIITNWC
jgi:acetylornithine deacetylase/succinyl-diaminopimelate desuccinylase-like protein